MEGNSMTTDVAQILVEAAAYLEAQQQDIIFRWVQLASRLPPHFRRPDEDLKQLIDHMPDVLVALRRVMLEPVDPVRSAAIPESIAVTHAVTRYRQQMSAGIVVKEYQLLRHQLWESLRRWSQIRNLTAEDVFLLEERINFALDEFIAVTLETFVDLENEGGDVESAESTDNTGR